MYQKLALIVLIVHVVMTAILGSWYISTYGPAEHLKSSSV